jgi:acyl-CoA synthetase (AMP-forming)/AMP-acid ligase II
MMNRYHIDQRCAKLIRPQIDYIPLVHAIQRLNGIASTFVAALSAAELEYQYRKSDIKAVFTCMPLLKTALEAAKAISLPEDRVFIMDVPGFDSQGPFATLEDLVKEGRDLPDLEPQIFMTGQGARQIAFLCYSSGTSGLPKAVMITHRNVIANTLQFTVHETVGRKKFGIETQNVVGVLPFSHIYGLVIVGHVSYYRGDQVIVLPKYDLTTFLASIEKHKINSLVIVRVLFPAYRPWSPRQTGR